ncbi:MAG: tetratricopeptide repeat protein [Bacteroidota bacterium]
MMIDRNTQLMKAYSVLKVVSCYSLLLLSSYGIFAQSTIYGTLSEADSIEIYLLGNQAYSLRRSSPDSALLLVNQALVKSEQFGNLPSQVSLWRIKGLVHYELKEYNKALEHCEIALTIARKSDHGVGIVLNSMGNVYFSQQNYSAAIGIYEEAAQYARTKKDTIALLDALHNLGSTYTNSGNFDAAIPYYEQSWEFYFLKINSPL